MIAQFGGRTKGSVLWLGSIPERDDVDAMLKNRVPHRVICEWLAFDRGYGANATYARLKAYIESPFGWRRHQGSRGA